MCLCQNGLDTLGANLATSCKTEEVRRDMTYFSSYCGSLLKIGPLVIQTLLVTGDSGNWLVTGNQKINQAKSKSLPCQSLTSLFTGVLHLIAALPWIHLPKQFWRSIPVYLYHYICFSWPYQNSNHNKCKQWNLKDPMSSIANQTPISIALVVF